MSVLSILHIQLTLLCISALVSLLLLPVAPCTAAATSRRRSKNSFDYAAETLGIRHTRFNVSQSMDLKQLITDLDDNYRWAVVLFRRLTMNAASQNGELWRKNQRQGKIQRTIPKTQQFPCNLTNARSPQPPTSVHCLRPGDIDVIGLVGDSASAGDGIVSDHFLHIQNEHRGLSFAGGGMGDWRTYLTLPNILKVFNPQLYGYSTANGLTIDRTSRLNVAEPLIMSRDLPFQVLIFIDRLRKDPHVDMQKHWKLLSIFVGNNDICSDMCHHKNASEFVQMHENDLRKALTLLRDNVPRLLVNLIATPNLVYTLHPMRNIPISCWGLQRVFCHCVFSEVIKGAKLQAASDTIDRWNAIDERLASLPEFQTDDFSVVYQPLTTRVKTPTLPNGDADLRYFAADCFHFSQLGHASFANALFNGMLQPVGKKELGIPPTYDLFDCPNEERPYLATIGNSKE